VKKSEELLTVFALCCLLEIVFWYFALLPGRTFFLRDLSLEIIPKRFFWANSGGFPLWLPYGFFGMPFAANPQSQAFYPFNFFYLLFGAERGLVFFIVFHHLLFLFTFYLALRRLGFSLEAGLIGAIGSGFGGFFCSLTLLIVLLGTIAWFPLIIICLTYTEGKGWFRPGLLIGPLIALQVLAGEIEMAAMSWLLAALAVALSPKNKIDARLCLRIPAAILIGAIFGALLSLFQLSLTLEMIPLSNRAGGFSVADAMAFSFHPLHIISIFVPNHLFPAESARHVPELYWGLGFFSEFPYFLSFYIGAVMVIPVFAGIFKADRGRGLSWLFLVIFSLLMAAGEHFSLYGIFCRIIPGFRMFRFPVKYYFLFSFSVIMLGCLGFEKLKLRARPRLSATLISIGLCVALFLLIYPARPQNFGDRYDALQGWLFLRSLLRVCSFILISAGVIFLAAGKDKRKAGLTLALLCFADLYLAHRWLNPSVGLDFYQGSALVRDFARRAGDKKYPARILSLSPAQGELDFKHVIDPVAQYAKIRDSLDTFWPALFGINDTRSHSSFHLADIPAFDDLIGKADRETAKIIMARAGVEHMYYRSVGFVPISAPFARAMIFYQASALGDRGQVLKLWSDPNFPAQEAILLEGGTAQGSTVPGMMAGPAEIIEYKNERVEIAADAKRDGWLLLLDTYYPGWKADLDGKRAPIFRADGFFRAVKIPAGKHRVVFNYHPQIFYNSLWLSGAGLIAWFGLLIFSFTIKKSGK